MGYDVGYKRGYDKGQAEMQERWEAWNGRRLEAKARGEAFDEPHPTLERRR